MKLSAGDLSLVYEDGFLRYIHLGDHEVIRMIYFALRDRNWGTIGGEIQDEEIISDTDSFKINYRWVSLNSQFPFTWHVSISGNRDHSILFKIDGQPEKTILKNRAGFCVLHPIAENAGHPCSVTDPSGNLTQGVFPKLISPHQPFKNIRSMQWPLGNMGSASIDFQGDIFEMEDQRNWTDDSYKTYCTPLDLKFPVSLTPESTVHQEILLSVLPNQPIKKKTETPVVEVTYGSKIDRLPGLGISENADGASLGQEELRRLGALKLDHYRVELPLYDSWQGKFIQRLSEANKLKVAIHVNLLFGQAADWEDQLKQFLSFMEVHAGSSISALAIFHKNSKTTPDALIRSVVPPIRKHLPGLPIGAGTLAYFTELNRERFDPKPLDFISYSVNPQVHAFDDASLTETLKAQSYTVESAMAYFPNCEIKIAPITLKPRFNPNATSEEKDIQGTLPSSVDPRQTTLYAANWMLGSIIHLAQVDTAAVSYFEASGWKGVLQGNSPSPLPELMPITPRQIFPVYHVLKFILEKNHHSIIPLKSSQPLSVKGLILQNPREGRFLLANYENKSVKIKFDLKAKKYRLIILEDHHFHWHPNSSELFEQLFRTVSEVTVKESLKLMIPARGLVIALLQY